MVRQERELIAPPGLHEEKFPGRSAPQSREWHVPSISDDRLKVLRTQMQPVVRNSAGELRYIAPVDARRVSFIWDPKFKGLARGLEEIGRITTYHGCAYYGFFKPSIAEVVAQIPPEHLPRTVAFETKIAAHDNWREVTSPEGDCHRATTILYGRKGKK